MGQSMKLIALLGLVQLISSYTIEDPFEPMVAFICGRPSMHRELNGWVSDAKTDCQQEMPDILAYCQHLYKNKNITNVVEASHLVTIDDWPVSRKASEGSDRRHTHTVRPFRCLAGGFQSDSLLVPQHCVFDHRHDTSLCTGFSHWNVVADEACRKKGTVWHLESFGMLLNCKAGVGKFSGVEYVCCPNEGEITELDMPTKDDDKPYKHDDDIVPIEGGSEKDEIRIDLGESEAVIDFYEAYLRGQEFPEDYNNEHKKFLAAKETMKKNQEAKNAKLLQDWHNTREHVAEVRKVDPARAKKLNKEISDRFEKLFASYQDEDRAEKAQLLALHQQNIQKALNKLKRETMDDYMDSLENGNSDDITEDLKAYIKAEEKDRMHTLNHFEHVKVSNPREARRIHPFIVNHLRLSEQRIDQALTMLARYPSMNTEVRPEIDRFLKKFAPIANSIKNMVLPEVEVEEESSEEDSDEYDMADSQEADARDTAADFALQNDLDEEDLPENEHDFEANAQDDSLQLAQNLQMAPESSGIGAPLAVALAGLGLCLVVAVAILAVRRRNLARRGDARPGPEYAVVAPQASPEERHVADMQMNGYENPTYKYFETQNTVQA